MIHNVIAATPGLKTSVAGNPPVDFFNLYLITNNLMMFKRRRRANAAMLANTAMPVNAAMPVNTAMPANDAMLARVATSLRNKYANILRVMS